jgi:hypothetical protein
MKKIILIDSHTLTAVIGVVDSHNPYLANMLAEAEVVIENAAEEALIDIIESELLGESAFIYEEDYESSEY